jgi:hypothetical protein
MTPCSLVDHYQGFGRKCFHLQGRRGTWHGIKWYGYRKRDWDTYSILPDYTAWSEENSLRRPCRGTSDLTLQFSDCTGLSTHLLGTEQQTVYSVSKPTLGWYPLPLSYPWQTSETNFINGLHQCQSLDVWWQYPRQPNRGSYNYLLESWRVSSSGIWRRVVRRVVPDVSEERIASIFRVEE